MKVYLAAYQPGRIGGGWSFASYLAKGLGDQRVNSSNDADVFFVSGASMIKPEEAEKAKAEGKRVVLRVDNALKHSRNEGKGMSRMLRIAKAADLVVYQCQWSKDYLDDYLGHPNSTIIYNGVDTDIFNVEGSRIDFHGEPVYLYSCASKGETKRWEWVWWRYQQIQKEQKAAKLIITGNLSTPVMQRNFDFFQDEQYQYLGMISNPQQMATIYRSCDYLFAVYENDCYSNTYLEAAMCGTELIEVNMTGGTSEMLENITKGREFNGIKRMTKDYIEAFNRL